MSDFDKTNTFSLNRNDKGDNDRRPDYKGEVNIDGTRYWLSGWIRNGANGSFISGPIELAEDKYQPNGQVPTAAGVESDSDIPFARKPIPNLENGPQRSRDLFTRSPEAF